MTEETKNQIAMKLLLFSTSSILKNLKELPPEQEKIIRMRFGLGGFAYKHTLEEIGYKWDITRDEVRSLESKAINNLLKKDGIVAKAIAQVATDLQQLKSKKKKKLSSEEKLLTSLFNIRKSDEER